MANCFFETGGIEISKVLEYRSAFRNVFKPNIGEVKRQKLLINIPYFLQLCGI
ncbi:MAG: hypothetical protein IPG79_01905 [Saprospiraceae bacterium]|nr:hypothetical protein [Saprospiraceae bacterium]